jgi:hypothetical protein
VAGNKPTSKTAWRWAFALMLLLCSCATPRQAEKPAAEKASKPFPPKYYAPAIHTSKPLVADRLSTTPMLDRSPAYTGTTGRARACPECVSTATADTVYLRDTLQIDSLYRELEIGDLTNQALRKRLHDTEADRDYWLDKNRQKFWALVAMGIFGFLYILFTVLASRIKES